ncbi:phospholipase A2 inhibitor and Ly6/PLAUR domain-containing protein-like [Anomaloglossus baeobatrachus]|uniref:phospholipase A2 inhibitor and Ly6/PLAUR domain-containing protein-like n=1 Tax=Anomaloglossus baeobatrachus TaxID=238106 RepID=UPI003F50B079
MKTLLVILHGVTFITTVSSLICESCIAENAATCTGYNDTCDSAVTTCISSVFQVSHQTFNVQMPQKSCGLPNICNISYSFTLNDTHVAATGICCDSDYCNKETPQVPERNLTMNGLKCPFCMEQGLDGCTPNIDTLCTGLEVMCMRYSGYINIGAKEAPKNISFQGCATSSACPAASSPPEESSKIRFSCTEGVQHQEEDDNSVPVNS